MCGVRRFLKRLTLPSRATPAPFYRETVPRPLTLFAMTDALPHLPSRLSALATPSRRQFLAAAGVMAAAPWGAFARETRLQPSTDAGGEGWITHTEVPPNREVRLPRLTENGAGSWITPVERFYVRSHAASPRIDLGSYRLSVDGLVERPLELTISDLLGMDQTEATATMTCAGNRRTEHSRTETIKGVPWQAGAIGNATWGGVRLSAILKQAGLQDDARHVWFDGLDAIDRGSETIAFGASIPVEKALGDSAAMPGALVCLRQNGQPLTPDHGFPVRGVVPGYIGARSVKWLGRIHVSNRPNPNHYQATAYKIVHDASPIEWAEKAPIYRMPLNGVITSPAAGASVNGPLDVTGYALPPGEEGVTIRGVDVSVDGGQQWRAAELIGPSQPLCWQLWRLTLDTAPQSLVVRATDSRGRSQPAATAWNKKGYLYNAQHRVELGR